MIDNDKLLAVVKSYLPDVADTIYQRITDEVRIEMDAAILSMIRQAVAQERRLAYKQNK